MQAFTAECDGAGTQRWVYSETEQTVRAADTGLCLGAGWATGVFVVDCGNGSFVNWVHGSDGRLRLREWQPGCLEDTRSEQLTWGGCDNQANEVWSLTTV